MKRKKKKSNDEVLVDHILELMDILKGLKHTDKRISAGMMSMFSEILAESPTFHKWLSNPKSDISKVEPLIKLLMKPKKK